MPNKLTRQEIIESRKLIDEALNHCHNLTLANAPLNRISVVSKSASQLYSMEGNQREIVIHLLALVMLDNFKQELIEQERLLRLNPNRETVQ